MESGNMSDAREQEGVEIIRVVWARDNTPRENTSNLIAFVRCEVDQDPDVDPEIGFLAFVELRAVD